MNEATDSIKVYSQYNNAIAIHVLPGHFATNHSHINYYMDMTTLKARSSEAKNAAKSIVSEYVVSTVIDTIVCMDDTEIIGAYIAEELTSCGFRSINTHDTVYVISPEMNAQGQLVFTDNIQKMVRNKHILLLLATATTGRTIERALECIRYYDGEVVGISALFSASSEIEGMPIHSVFSLDDFPKYQSYSHSECPYCKAGQKLDAIVNSYGYMKL